MDNNFFAWVRITYGYQKQLERKIAMVRFRLEGETYRKIGERFGLSATRPSQIFGQFERMYKRYQRLQVSTKDYTPIPFDKLSTD